MIAVIFEVYPATDRKGEYLEMAADLRPYLEEIEGFISVERFQSVTDPSKMLSVSFFEDEDALNNWRNTSKHRIAQKHGRAGMFAGYRLRVAHVIRDYGMDEREEAPLDSIAAHG